MLQSRRRWRRNDTIAVGEKTKRAGEGTRPYVVCALWTRKRGTGEDARPPKSKEVILRPVPVPACPI